MKYEVFARRNIWGWGVYVTFGETWCLSEADTESLAEQEVERISKFLHNFALHIKENL